MLCDGERRGSQADASAWKKTRFGGENLPSMKENISPSLFSRKVFIKRKKSHGLHKKIEGAALTEKGQARY